jgi:hypothetical protein
MAKAVSVKMAKELDREIRIWAACLDIGRSEFVRQALEEKVARLAGAANGAARGQVAQSFADACGAEMVDEAGDASTAEKCETNTEEDVTR